MRIVGKATVCMRTPQLCLQCCLRPHSLICEDRGCDIAKNSRKATSSDQKWQWRRSCTADRLDVCRGYHVKLRLCCHEPCGVCTTRWLVAQTGVSAVTARPSQVLAELVGSCKEVVARQGRRWIVLFGVRPGSRCETYYSWKPAGDPS